MLLARLAGEVNYALSETARITSPAVTELARVPRIRSVSEVWAISATVLQTKPGAFAVADAFPFQFGGFA